MLCLNSNNPQAHLIVFKTTNTGTKWSKSTANGYRSSTRLFLKLIVHTMFDELHQQSLDDIENDVNNRGQEEEEIEDEEKLVRTIQIVLRMFCLNSTLEAVRAWIVEDQYVPKSIANMLRAWRVFLLSLNAKICDAVQEIDLGEELIDQPDDLEDLEEEPEKEPAPLAAQENNLYNQLIEKALRRIGYYERSALLYTIQVCERHSQYYFNLSNNTLHQSITDLNKLMSRYDQSPAKTTKRQQQQQQEQQAPAAATTNVDYKPNVPNMVDIFYQSLNIFSERVDKIFKFYKSSELDEETDDDDNDNNNSMQQQSVSNKKRKLNNGNSGSTNNKNNKKNALYMQQIESISEHLLWCRNFAGFSIFILCPPARGSVLKEMIFTTVKPDEKHFKGNAIYYDKETGKMSFIWNDYKNQQ